MENWSLQKVVKYGRVSLYVFFISLGIVFADGFILGYKQASGNISEAEFQEKMEKGNFLSNTAGFLMLPSLIFAFVSAAEASGRTREKRITTKELGRRFTAEEVRKANDLYYNEPAQFPWHHIMMVPQFGLGLHLKYGWSGIPRELIPSQQTKLPSNQSTVVEFQEIQDKVKNIDNNTLNN